MRSAVLHIFSGSTIDTRNKYIPFIKLHITVKMSIYCLDVCLGLFQLYTNGTFHSSSNPGGRQLSKLSYSTTSRSNRKNIFKSFFYSNKWLFIYIPPVYFVLFKSHQTLYISVILAHSVNTLLSYLICLWIFHIQCE